MGNKSISAPASEKEIQTVMITQRAKGELRARLSKNCEDRKSRGAGSLWHTIIHGKAIKTKNF